MKVVQIKESIYASMKNTPSDIGETFEELNICYKFKLADRMAERNLTVRKLSALTGLRLATISDLMTGKKGALNLSHIALLMLVLRIADINDLIEIYIPEDLKEKFERDSSEWIRTGEIPSATNEIYELIKKG